MFQLSEKDFEKEWLQWFQEAWGRRWRCLSRQKQKRINNLPSCWFTDSKIHFERRIKIQSFRQKLLARTWKSSIKGVKKVQSKQERKELSLHTWVQESQKSDRTIFARKRTWMYWVVFWCSWRLTQVKDLPEGLNWLLQLMEKKAWDSSEQWRWCPWKRNWWILDFVRQKIMNPSPAANSLLMIHIYL